MRYIISIVLMCLLYPMQTISAERETWVGGGLGDPAGINLYCAMFYKNFGFQITGLPHSFEKYAGRIGINYKLFESNFDNSKTNTVSYEENQLTLNDSREPYLLSTWISIVYAKADFKNSISYDYLGIGLNARWGIFYIELGPKINVSGRGFENDPPVLKYGFFQFGVVFPFL